MFAFISILFFLNTAYAAKIPNSDHPNAFLGPTVRGTFNHLLTDYMGYSIAGELGRGNYRAGAGVAWNIAEGSRLKLSADFLRQNITYSFFDSNTGQWVKQETAGLAYQFQFSDILYQPEFNFDAYGLYSQSKDISTGQGTFVNNAGETIPFTNMK